MILNKTAILSTLAGMILVSTSAFALQVENKCIVASDKNVTSSGWTTLCSTSLPKFASDPGSGVTTFDVDAGAIVLDMTNALGEGFAYQITESCGQSQSDPHAIPEASLANFGGVTAPMPAIGVLNPTNDPLGTTSCTVGVQARAYGGSGTIVVKADQDHAVSGVDDATAFHIIAYTKN